MASEEIVEMYQFDIFPTFILNDHHPNYRCHLLSLSGTGRIMSSQTTSLRNSRSPSPTGYISSPAPANNGSPSVPRPSSSSASSAASSSSSSDGDSETTSAYYAREDQLQWDESVRQLKSIIHLCAIPFFGKWAGRKWGYYS